ncbi:MAG: TonB-dependent receptor [Gallionellaceae bacterium]
MKKIQLLAAIFCCLTTFAHAIDDLSLDEVVVTATRVQQPLDQTLSSTSVITRQDIQESQVADLPSVLKNLAGVEFYQSGGIGKQSSLFMRGTSANQVLILIDGVRINSATTGSTAIDQIMLDQVDRIEVVRGNVSSLYGSDAIGGVIQIFTRRNAGEMAFNGSAGVGSNNSHRAAAGLGGKIHDTDFGLNISRFKTDGISAINPAIASNANPDNDGYDNTSLTANLRHAFNTEHSLSATVFNSVGRNQYDVSGVATDIHENASVLNKLSLSSDNRLTESWQSKLQLAQGSDEYKGYKNDVLIASSSIKTVNDQAFWQNTLALSTWGKLILGAENLNQKVVSSTAYTKTQRQVNSVLAGFTGNYGSHQLQLNTRRDNYSDFGEANTGLLGYGYAVSAALRLTASVSSAFKAPTFNDLFYPGFSNPNLNPERSTNTEAGVHYARDKRSLDLVYFDNQINNLIVFSGGTPKNLSLARINGVELNYVEQFDNTKVNFTLTRQNPRDTETGLLLLRRAQSFANLALAQQLGSWRIGGELQYSGEREDTDINTFNRTTLGSYSLVNITSRYQWDKHIDISLRADNLLNREYMLAHGYNTLGRTFFISLNYQ